jgi:hypothetical protein
MAVCANRRLSRAQGSPAERFRGYLPRKTRDVYGLKVPFLVTKEGPPVEFLLTHGGFREVDALK